MSIPGNMRCPLEEAAQQLLRQPAVVTGDHIISYAQLNSAVWAAVDHLRAQGVRPHQRIGVLSPNSIDYVILLLALWRLGAAACLFNTRLPPQAVQQQMKRVKGQRLFSSLKFSSFLKSSVAEDRQWSYPDDQDTTILFTSGSSGEPKAVCHRFANHYYNAKGANEHIPITAGDRWLLSLPLFHVGGLGIVFRSLLGGGAIVIAPEKEKISQALRRYQLTHLSVVTTQLYWLLQDQNNAPLLRKLKAILLGGSPVPEPLIHQSVQHRLPVYTTYGLTEMASQVATSMPLTTEDPFPQAKILNYRQVRISPQGTILVRGETLFKGYVEGAHVRLPLTEEGWFETNDMGHLTSDGCLTVIGRRDNMFISGGENIQPEEIEQHLCQLEAIEEAVVVPVGHEEFGFRPIAFVKKKKEASVKKEEIVAHLQKYLPKFKIPDRLYDWPGHVKTRGMKMNRQYLTQLAQERKARLSLLA